MEEQLENQLGIDDLSTFTPVVGAGPLSLDRKLHEGAGARGAG
jgi:hypothetical protein